MYLIDDKEKFYEFIKGYYKIIRDNNPGKYDKILTDEAARNFVNDDKKLEEFKANFLKNMDSQIRAEATKGFKYQNSNFNRIVSASYSLDKTTEALENNAKLRLDSPDSMALRETANKKLNDLLNLDYSKVDFSKLDETEKYFNDNIKDLEIGFVINSVYTSEFAKQLGYSDNFVKYLSEYKPLFELTGDPRLFYEHKNSFLSFITPDTVEVDDIINASGDLDTYGIDVDEFEEFKHEGHTFNKQMALFGYMQSFEPQLNSFYPVFNKILEKYNVHTFKEMLNYNFADGTKKISVDEAVSMIREGKEVNLILKTPEEKAELDKVLAETNKTSFESFLSEENSQLRMNMAVEFYHAFQEAYPDVPFKLEDFTKNVNNKEALDNCARSLEISKSKAIKEQMVQDIKKDRVSDQGVSRGIYTKIDLNKSYDENVNAVNEATSIYGAHAIKSSELKKIWNTNVKEHAYKTDKEYIDNYEKDEKEVGYGFIAGDMLTKQNLNITGEMQNIKNNSIEAVQMFSLSDTTIKQNSNPLNVVCPINMIGKGLIDFDKNKMIFEKVLGNNFNKFKEFNDYSRFVHKSENAQAFGLNHMAMTEACDKSRREKDAVLEMIEKGLISETPQKDNYFMYKDGNIEKQVPFGKYLDAYMDKDNHPEEFKKYNVKEYNEFQKSEINKALDNPYKDGPLRGFMQLYSNKAQILECIDNIANAHSLFKSRDSEEYNKMIASFDEVKEVFNNGPLKNMDSLNAMGESYKNTFKKVANMMINLSNLAGDYKDKKSSQWKFGARQARFDNASKLVELIDKDCLEGQLNDLKPSNEESIINKVDPRVVNNQQDLVEEMEVEEANDELNTGFYIDSEEEELEFKKDLGI